MLARNNIWHFNCHLEKIINLVKWITHRTLPFAVYYTHTPFRVEQCSPTCGRRLRSLISCMYERMLLGKFVVLKNNSYAVAKWQRYAPHKKISSACFLFLEMSGHTDSNHQYPFNCHKVECRFHAKASTLPYLRSPPKTHFRFAMSGWFKFGELYLNCQIK